MSSRYPHPWGVVASRYRKLRRELPTIVSNMARNEFQDNFGREGVGGYRTAAGFQAWTPRKAPPRNRRDASRSVLVKSARLRRGLRIAPDYQHARVINRVPYAPIHNDGGKIRGRARVVARSRRTGKLTWRRTASPATMPARPFMEPSPQLMADIEKELFTEIDRLFR